MQDINYLIDTYFGLNNSSTEASSHWQKYQIGQKINYKRSLLKFKNWGGARHFR
jgi:hypothetical protein